jgi:hypothetical protein
MSVSAPVSVCKEHMIDRMQIYRMLYKVLDAKIHWSHYIKCSKDTTSISHGQSEIVSDSPYIAYVYNGFLVIIDATPPICPTVYMG